MASVTEIIERAIEPIRERNSRVLMAQEAQHAQMDAMMREWAAMKMPSFLAEPSRMLFGVDPGWVSAGVAVAAVAPAIPELPEAPQPSSAVATEYNAEYAALAEKVGFSCPELLEQKLLNFLHENGYSTYDVARVANYMDVLIARLQSERPTVRLHWLWRPLRAQDVKDRPGREEGFPASGDRIYARPIPMPVLQTVADIAEKLPDARFYVSDYEERKPDPFLAVKLSGMSKFFVIERWDEPSFR